MLPALQSRPCNAVNVAPSAKLHELYPNSLGFANPAVFLAEALLAMYLTHSGHCIMDNAPMFRGAETPGGGRARRRSPRGCHAGNFRRC